MPLPQTLLTSLGPTIPFASPLSRSAAAVPAAGGAGGGMVQWDLGFVMQLQTQTNWCWAATSSSVHRFYVPKAKDWSQCEVAEAELNHNTCCADGSTSQCNVPWYLDRALVRVKHFQSMSGGAVPATTLSAELGGGRPVGCRIGWAGGGGHFVVIDGLTLSGTTTVTVRDPIYGTTAMDYATFQTAYQGSGSWTHTYTTKA